MFETPSTTKYAETVEGIASLVDQVQTWERKVQLMQATLEDLIKTLNRLEKK